MKFTRKDSYSNRQAN